MEVDVSSVVRGAVEGDRKIQSDNVENADRCGCGG